VGDEKTFLQPSLKPLINRDLLFKLLYFPIAVFGIFFVQNVVFFPCPA